MLTKVESGAGAPGAVVPELLTTLWPPVSARDSEHHRQKKAAVLGGHLAVGAIVLVAILGAIVAGFERLSGWRLVGLAVTGLAYVAWSLYVTRDAVRFVVSNGGSGIAAAAALAWPANDRLRSVMCVAVQFGLAEVIVWLAEPARVMGVLWLVLLPPVGHAVMLFGRLGIGVVAAVSVALHVVNVVGPYGWEALPRAVPAFAVAVAFTLVFTQIAVSAEKARGEVERLAAALGEANGKLREYALQAEELSATRERNRVAREIHDSLGHHLTVVHVQLEAARATLDRDPAHARDALEKAQSMTHAGLQEVRRSVASLRASPLENRPLAEALRRVVDECAAAGLAVEFEVLGDARPLSPQAELTLYRAGQEGLTNCRKHARATRARVVLDYRDPAAVRFVVGDDGVGVADANGATGGFGLLGLRERAQLLGGSVGVRTSPGNGFSLTVEVPA